MNILGHSGITLGAVWLLKAALDGGHDQTDGADVPEEATGKAAGSGVRQRLSAVIGRIDVRLLIIGSLLPDIIDKPLGIYLMWGTFGTGRIYGHTLLFLIIISLAGLLVYRRYGRIWLPTLAFGVFTHLLLDRMWANLPTLLWPLYGFAFPRIEVSYWLKSTFASLFIYPQAYVPEIIGLLVLIWFLFITSFLIFISLLFPLVPHREVLIVP